MKRSEYINSFVGITKERLEKELPEEATEGEFIAKSFSYMKGLLKHILIEKKHFPEVKKECFDNMEGFDI